MIKKSLRSLFVFVFSFIAASGVSAIIISANIPIVAQAAGGLPGNGNLPYPGYGDTVVVQTADPFTFHISANIPIPAQGGNYDPNAPGNGYPWFGIYVDHNGVSLAGYYHAGLGYLYNGGPSGSPEMDGYFTYTVYEPGTWGFQVQYFGTSPNPGQAQTADSYVYVTVSQNYTVSGQVQPPGSGTISPTSQMVTSGSTTTLTANANTGYKVNSISGCGGTPVSFPTRTVSYIYTTGAITNNCTVTVIFIPEDNIPPTANAGPDQVITLPTSSVSVTGSGSDSNGSVISQNWTFESGPITPTIKFGTTYNPTFAGMTTTGVYTFKLTVTDNGNASGFDTMQVTVNPAVVTNNPPVANPGPNKSVYLPTTSVSVTGSGTDPDAGDTITGYQWAFASSSSGVTPGISSPTSATTNFTGLTTAGTYNFTLKVKDNHDAWSNPATMQVTVYFTAAGIDLVPDAPGPTSAPNNVTTILSASIKNVGDTGTGTTFSNIFRVADAANGGGTIVTSPALTMSALGPSGSAIASWGFFFSGIHTWSVQVCADQSPSFPAGTIAEFNEANNCSGWVNVDVSAAAYTASQIFVETPASGAVVSGTIPIKGYFVPGGSVASGGTDGGWLSIEFRIVTPYTVLASGSTSGNNGVFSLVRNDLTQYAGYAAFPYMGFNYNTFNTKNFPNGAATIQMYGRGNDTVTKNVPITIANYPNLTASAVTPATAIAGAATTFNATVSNIGSMPTGAAFTNVFQFDDNTDHNTILASYPASANALAEGGTAPISVPFTIPTAGTYYARACADNNAAMVGTINEGPFETDNCGPWTTINAGAGLPTVTTSPVTNITSTSATSGGNIISNGGSPVTVSGIVWRPVAQGANPTIPLPGQQTTDGWAIGGPWPSNITAINPSTTYYVRAYATNSAGTAYGANVTFTSTVAMSGTLLPATSTCTIPLNGSSCTQTLTWTTTNPVGTSAVTSATGTPSPSTSVNNGSQLFTAPYNASGVIFNLYNNAQLLAQATVSTACVAGSAWNSGQGKCISTGPAPSGDISMVSACSIAIGASTCTPGRVTWSTANLPVGSLTELTRNNPEFTSVSTAASGSNFADPNAMRYGPTGYYLYNNGSLLDSYAVDVACVSGAAWNGSACAASASAPNVALTASPNSIPEGASTTLSWSSDGDYCTSTFFEGQGASSGTLSVSPTASTTYTIACVKNGVSTSAQTTVTVGGAGSGSKVPTYVEN